MCRLFTFYVLVKKLLNISMGIVKFLRVHYRLDHFKIMCERPLVIRSPTISLLCNDAIACKWNALNGCRCPKTWAINLFRCMVVAAPAPVSAPTAAITITMFYLNHISFWIIKCQSLGNINTFVFLFLVVVGIACLAYAF